MGPGFCKNIREYLENNPHHYGQEIIKESRSIDWGIDHGQEGVMATTSANAGRVICRYKNNPRGIINHN